MMRILKAPIAILAWLLHAPAEPDRRVGEHMARITLYPEHRRRVRKGPPR